MSTIQLQAVAKRRIGLKAMKSKHMKSTDAAWLVLEAANDLGDQAAVDACRRVIDAKLNGMVAARSDLHLLLDYFR